MTKDYIMMGKSNIMLFMYVIILSIFPYNADSQSTLQDRFRHFYGFGKYLTTQNDHIRSISEFNKALYLNNIGGLKMDDSLYYLIGLSYSKIPDYISSNTYLSKVSKSHDQIYSKSVFQIGKNYFNSSSFNAVIDHELNLDYSFISHDYSQKLKLLLASSYLTLDDSETACSVLEKSDLHDSMLYSYSQESLNHKNKSAFVAGSLSALLPGAGKFYTHNVEHGLVSLFVIGLIGYRTAIEYRRGGPGSTGFIVFGAMFLITYTGNIIGSAISAKHYNERYYSTFNSKISNFVNALD